MASNMSLDPALAADINARCRLTGKFTLRSGQIATEYFDKYLFEGDPQLLRRVAEAMVPLLPGDAQILGGLEMGGIPIVTMVSGLTGLPAVFVRKQAKTHGTCRLAEGGEVEGRRITLIEDVITTGGAAVDATHALRERGATVDTLVCAIDRSEAGANRLDGLGVQTRSVMPRADLDAVS